MVKVNISPIERFRAKYEVDPISGCYNWIAAKTNDGYGTFKDHKQYRAHRWIYQYLNGPIPKGLVVRHKCHNPSCVNPEHLELGTQQDNIDDRDKARRTARGEKHPQSILTEQDVILIKKFFKRHNERGVGTFLSRWFNVCQASICEIKMGNLWSYIEV